jgi:nitrate reductase NapE component
MQAHAVEPRKWKEAFRFVVFAVAISPVVLVTLVGAYALALCTEIVLIG